MNCLFGKWIAFLCARSVVWVRSCCVRERGRGRKYSIRGERQPERPRAGTSGDGSEMTTHLGQPPADGAGLLGAHVKGQLLALVQLAKVGARLQVDDGQDAGNRLADGRAGFERNKRTVSTRPPRPCYALFGENIDCSLRPFPPVARTPSYRHPGTIKRRVSSSSSSVGGDRRPQRVYRQVAECASRDAVVGVRRQGRGNGSRRAGRDDGAS